MARTGPPDAPPSALLLGRDLTLAQLSGDIWTPARLFGRNLDTPSVAGRYLDVFEPPSVHKSPGNEGNVRVSPENASRICTSTPTATTLPAALRASAPHAVGTLSSVFLEEGKRIPTTERPGYLGTETPLKVLLEGGHLIRARDVGHRIAPVEVASQR